MVKKESMKICRNTWSVQWQEWRDDSQKSIVRLIRVGFVAAGARELSLLPLRIARKTSWLSWLFSAAIDRVVKWTTQIGIGVSNLFDSRSRSGQGVPCFGKKRDLELVKPFVVPPTRTVVDTTEEHPVPVYYSSFDAAGLVLVPKKRRARVLDRSLADRKLLLLKRSGLFGEDTKEARIERACTFDDLRKAYKLVHDVRLSTGSIEPEAGGMRLRVFEMSPDLATFVAKVEGRVIGVLSVSEDTPEFGMPADGPFKVELDCLRARGARLCEATNLAVAEQYRKSSVPTELMRCAVAHMIKAGYDQAVVAVRPSHNAFYELLGFREIGSERSYSQRFHHPAVAHCLDIDQYRIFSDGLNATEQFIHHFLAFENHFLAYVGDWDLEAKRRFSDADLLAQLFVTERNLIAECSPVELEVLQRRWGHELFSEVVGGMFIPWTENSVKSALPSLFGVDSRAIWQAPGVDARSHY